MHRCINLRLHSTHLWVLSRCCAAAAHCSVLFRRIDPLATLWSTRVLCSYRVLNEIVLARADSTATSLPWALIAIIGTLIAIIGTLIAIIGMRSCLLAPTVLPLPSFPGGGVAHTLRCTRRIRSIHGVALSGLRSALRLSHTEEQTNGMVCLRCFVYSKPFIHSPTVCFETTRVRRLWCQRAPRVVSRSTWDIYGYALACHTRCCNVGSIMQRRASRGTVRAVACRAPWRECDRVRAR